MLRSAIIGRMTTEQAAQLENWFTHHPPKPGQVKRYEDIRDFGRIFAALITDNCPDGAERDAAVLRVREAVMLANASIACNEAGG